MEPKNMKELSGNFIQYLMSHLIFPLEEQDHVGTDKDFWCLDWWIIEICKYLFEGEVGYLRFPIARRLGGNKNFDKGKIVKAILSKLEAIKEATLLPSNEVVVLETCRGFDTVLVRTVKDWDKVYVSIESDHPQVRQKTKEYLSRFSEVEIIGGEDKVKGDMYRMKTNGFEGIGG